jgi:beta-glucosidase
VTLSGRHHAWDEYGKPTVFITETGSAIGDRPESSDVHDQKRTAYLQGGLKMLSKATREGSNICGYFVWSLLDNFELSEGTRKRFVIVHVNFSSQRQVIKDSGCWYTELIRCEKGRQR